MRKFLNAVVLIPLGVIFLVFAVANRHTVTVSFDPFNSHDPALGFDHVPLFVVIITTAILGVVAGSSATWIGQRRWRRAARHHEAEAREARRQLDDLRASLATSQRRDPGVPVALPQVSYRRDKQGATL
jgi:uncharacterized integral membrane protein